MKNKRSTRLTAILLCLALLMALLPLSAAAAADPVTLVSGDVRQGFAPAGASCPSSDPSVAWVDDAGALNALRAGSARITLPGGETCQVTVRPYEDGSEIVGRLKLLARYNDSMAFYDGHVYLLFTSYQDGVDVTVDDLYGGYRLSDAYYDDVGENIAFGSNHWGSDTDRYFTFDEDMTSVTLDRGEIVTIGMYRGFDLSVAQAALGALQNCSVWTDLSSAAKAVLGAAMLQVLGSKTSSVQEAFENFKQVCAGLNVNINRLLDGTVEGGVCFNRELYNQKLEWDQYENVTYELDITRKQLEALTATLGGNLDRFSIFKNSCVTVALNAWNAAVGTRDGENTAFHLEPQGQGIFALMDAPRTVKQGVMKRLPGYCLNNADGVQEPDAGFTDDTGWVYVSAPEKVAPLTFTYSDPSLQIDESRTRMSSLLTAARGDRRLVYTQNQQIPVTLSTSWDWNTRVVDKIVFSVNGSSLVLNQDNVPADGLWLKARLTDDAPYIVTDEQGNALPSIQEDGWISFFCQTLPARFELVKSPSGSLQVLDVTVVNGDAAAAPVKVFTLSGSTEVALGSRSQLAAGAKFFVRAGEPGSDDYVLTDVLLDEESVMGDYDSYWDAYTVFMPDRYARLKIVYAPAFSVPSRMSLIQTFAGEDLWIEDCMELYEGDDHQRVYGETQWEILEDKAGILSLSDDRTVLTPLKAGEATVAGRAVGNSRLRETFQLQVYASRSDVVLIDGEGESFAKAEVLFADGSDSVTMSGTYVPKGTVLRVSARPWDPQVISEVKVNGRSVAAGETFTANEDLRVRVSFREAQVNGMPATVTLPTRNDTFQLKASVAYSDALHRLLPVYDKSIRYVSADPLVAVDASGKITVTGAIPQGGKAVMVTAYAGSSGDTVCASTKVILGDYEGSRVVGKLTIYARPIVQHQLVAHSAVAFLPYEDVDLNVSYYHYYKPRQEYIDLLQDYENQPSRYPSDPALFTEEIDIADRDSYFEDRTNAPGADPETVSLKPGQTVCISNYSFDSSNLLTLLNALEGEGLADSPEAQRLIAQLRQSAAGEKVNEAEFFDNVGVTVGLIRQALGNGWENPANGWSDGGLTINREMLNQFHRSEYDPSGIDSQMPNNYYAVEITADELALLQEFLADPEHNHYNLFTLNCGNGAVNLWNAVFAGEPDLQLKGNYTGLVTEPESIYVEVGLMKLRRALRGSGGVDFYPRWQMSPDRFQVSLEELVHGQAGVSQTLAAPGETVIITPQPDEGYEVGYVSVTDDQGGEIAVKDEGDGTFSFVQPESDVTVDVLFWVNPFVDVTRGRYYYEPVYWAAKNEIVSGTDATHFSPAAGCTRAQLVTFLWRLADSPKPTRASSPFTDVLPGKYYYDAVLWAYENDIVAGLTATTFGPNKPVTRAQAVSFLYRRFGWETEADNPFTDVAQGKYYYDAVLWAVENGVTAGLTESAFGPGNVCQRGQVVSFLYRALN